MPLDLILVTGILERRSSGELRPSPMAPGVSVGHERLCSLLLSVFLHSPITFSLPAQLHSIGPSAGRKAQGPSSTPFTHKQGNEALRPFIPAHFRN